MEKFAVIVAGGSGTRMGNSMPKQFLEVAGKPLLIHTIASFHEAYEDMAIIVVLPHAHLETGKSLIDQFFPSCSFIHITSGGVTRFESVKNGIQFASDESIVFVHDAVRSMVTPSLIQRCFAVAREKGSAIPVVPIKDSIRRVTTDGSVVLDREILRAVQTPQTFYAGELKKAFLQPYQSAFTDEATVVEYAGGKVELIEGEETNIKVTYPSDLLMAEQFFLRDRSGL